MTPIASASSQPEESAMSIRIGFGIGPFHVSASSHHRRHHRRKKSRRRNYGKRQRFHMLAYWLFGLFAIELAAWLIAGELLLVWWLLWLTTAALIGEVAKRRQLPASWGAVVESTRPVWPKRKPIATSQARRSIIDC